MVKKKKKKPYLYSLFSRRVASTFTSCHERFIRFYSTQKMGENKKKEAEDDKKRPGKEGDIR